MEKAPGYYAMVNGERRGPFPLEGLVENGVRPQTYVWTRGMADWEKAGDVPDICRYFRNRLHDLMHPPRPASAAPQPETARHQQAPGIGFRGMELPSVEEVSEPKDPARKPWAATWLAVAALVVFPPMGWLALRSSVECRKAWREGRAKEAHALSAAAKMWGGVSLCLGLVFWATFIRNL